MPKPPTTKSTEFLERWRKQNEPTQRPLFPTQGENEKQKSPPKGKRLTLPLEDRLVLAEFRDLIVGDMDSRLERIAVAVERIATRLENGGVYLAATSSASIHKRIPEDKF